MGTGSVRAIKWAGKEQCGDTLEVEGVRCWDGVGRGGCKRRGQTRWKGAWWVTWWVHCHAEC